MESSWIKDNFDSVIHDNDYVILEFYPPWCGHCKVSVPEYAEMSKKLEEANSLIKLDKINSFYHQLRDGYVPFYSVFNGFGFYIIKNYFINL